MKIIYKIFLFMILCFFLAMAIYNISQKPYAIEDAIKGKFDPDEKIELFGLVNRNINNTAFYVDIFGFDDPILVVHGFQRTFPTSNVHNICLWGYFDHFGVFHALEYRMSYWQIIKYIISAIGFIWFLWIFFKEWKITRRGFDARVD